MRRLVRPRGRERVVSVGRLSTEDQALRDELVARARAGSRAAAFRIYDLWPFGPGSAHWLKRAAEAGHVDAEQQLYHHYADLEDRSKTLRWLRVAAERGNPEWMNYLGEALRDGSYSRKNVRAAAEWCRRAAEAGVEGGAHNYGYTLFHGRGVKRDRAAAAHWYEVASRRGWGRDACMFNLGLMYRSGEGVEKDLATALYWFRRAARLGHALATYWVAMLYDGGEGYPERPRLAVRWLKRAIARYQSACYAVLGLRYEEGRGVRRDPHEAARLYRQGAEDYDADACYYLGRCYEDGLGVRKNTRLAVHWLQEASRLARGKCRETEFSAEETLAYLHWLRGENSEAIRRGERALALARTKVKRARVLHTLGYCYEQAGRLVEAGRAFRECARLDPTDSEVRAEAERIGAALSAARMH